MDNPNSIPEAVDAIQEESAKTSIASASSQIALRRKIALSILSVIVITLCVILIQRLFFTNSHEETDDAYVIGHPHQVSARIENVVEEVLVDDNDHVEKGQLLIKLDPRDFEVDVEKAIAKLNVAKREAEKAKEEISYAARSADAETMQATGGIAASHADIDNKKAKLADATNQVAVTKSELAEAQAQYIRAELDYKRFTILEGRGVVSTQQKEHSISDYEVSKNARDAKEQSVQQSLARCAEVKSEIAQADAQLQESFGKNDKAKSAHIYTEVTSKNYDVAKAAIETAESEVKTARLQLAYCNVYAPVTGHVGKRTVEIGHRIEPGQQLLDIVEDYVWVVANFKETQTKRMAVGQIATIRIDSLPDKQLQGVIDSFSPGSGASFALLPPDNATGNFTKIVQRVPVKIRFTKSSLDELRNSLPVGLSSVVDVDTTKCMSENELAQLRKMDSPRKKIWDGDGKGI